ncbi:hypothetical protein DXG01_004511 [Tephrocybe rancida]|nr:hypothetical protein DXG01_004511 [Tephrocybe rancida]
MGKQTTLGATGPPSETVKPYLIQRQAIPSTEMYRYTSSDKTNIPGSAGVKNSPAANTTTEQLQEKGKGKETQQPSIEEVLDPQSPKSNVQVGKLLQPILCHDNDLGNVSTALSTSFSSEIPDSVLMAMSKGHANSRTPSLASLIPPSATLTKGSLESVEELMLESTSMWKGISHVIKVIMFDELLHASVERYHHRYGPQQDDDPLLLYGVVDGKLAGKTAEETILLRDAVIQWTQPHMDLVWETLPLAVVEFKDHQIPQESISEYMCGGVHMYGLEALDLDEVAHIVLAIEQIFSALAQFVQDNRKAAFHLDLNFHFI